MRTKTLYITNLGLLDNLAQTQILPYLAGLSRKGVEITILSFEKKEHLGSESKVKDMEKKLKDLDIDWNRLPYHRRWGNILDVFAGLIKTLQIVKNKDITILHARASIPILIAWPVAKLLKCKIIYDRRGTIVGDFTDDINIRNIFSVGFFSTILDAIDNFIIKHSEATIVLSEKAKKLVKGGRYFSSRDNIIESIPCCADMLKFSNVEAQGGLKVDLGGKFIMCYLGSLGTCYLLKEMAEFFKVVKEKKENAIFLIISHTDREYIDRVLQMEGLRKRDDYIMINLKPEEIPEYLAACDCSIMFIKPADCKIGSSPTKFGESLAAGIPVIVNRGIGDTEAIIRSQGVGVVVKGLNVVSYEKAFFKLLELLEKREDLKKRCKDTATEFFSLVSGVEKYAKIYERISGKV